MNAFSAFIPQILGDVFSASTLLSWLGQQVFYATVVAVFVALFLTVFRIQNPLARQGLWSLILLRLILPVDLASPYSLREVGEAIFSWGGDKTAPIRVETQLTPIQPMVRERAIAREIIPNKNVNTERHTFSPVLDTAPLITSSIPQKAADTSLVTPQSISRILVIAWVFGMAFFALRYVREWLRYYFLTRRSRSVRDARVDALVAAWRGHMGVTRPVRLIAGTSTLSPFTMGTLRPVIYVPRTLLGRGREHALDAALGHEMAHVRRYDDLWIKVEAMVKILYFFFPLIWWAGNRIEVAREEACDALALTRGKRNAKAYADGLLTTLRLAIRTPQGAPCPGLSQDKTGLKSRLLRLKSAGHSRWANLRAVGLIVLVGGCTLPMASAADAPPPPQEVEDAFTAAEAPTPGPTPTPRAAPQPQPAPMPVAYNTAHDRSFDPRFEQAMKEHNHAIATMKPDIDGQAALEKRMARFKEREQESMERMQERLEREQDRIEREQERLQREIEREVRNGARLEREVEREARHEMRRARREIRHTLASTQREALQEAMKAMAEMEEALSEIDWDALSELNEGLDENADARVDVAAILRDAGVFDLRQRVVSAMEEAHRDALMDVEESLKSIEQRVQQN